MTIFIMALEPIETRYTGQWYEGLPKLIRETATDRNIEVEVINVAGEQVDLETTPGAFLNFSATNIWKNTQINQMAKWFAEGKVKDGDHVLFTDAWHPGIIQIKYMSELLGIKVKIHSMWHAGSYDPQDFLGRLIQDKEWTYNVERAYFFASDFNYFATVFHRDLFLETLMDDARYSYTCKPLPTHLVPGLHKRCIISGQPHAALVDALRPFKGMVKKRQILFPHRLAPEKQLDIFKDLEKHIPDVDFVVCQEKKLTKDEYHTLLGESMMVFSANLQETLGISAMEGVLVDAIPFVPDRLSYSEMYFSKFIYPSEWTENWEAYEANREALIRTIRAMLANYSDYLPALEMQRNELMEHFLTCKPMLDELLK